MQPIPQDNMKLQKNSRSPGPNKRLEEEIPHSFNNQIIPVQMNKFVESISIPSQNVQSNQSKKKNEASPTFIDIDKPEVQV